VFLKITTVDYGRDGELEDREKMVLMRNWKKLSTALGEELVEAGAEEEEVEGEVELEWVEEDVEEG